jgi:hypothetical protein
MSSKFVILIVLKLKEETCRIRIGQELNHHKDSEDTYERSKISIYSLLLNCSYYCFIPILIAA